MKISRPTFIRIILWLSLIVFMIINVKVSMQETWQTAVINIVIPISFLFAVGYFLYLIVNSIFQVLTNRPNNKTGNELLDEKDLLVVPSRLILSLHNETRYIDYEEIVRCEADNSYTIFKLATDEKILVSKPLKEYADLLRPSGFLRTHQSHLVNPKYVKSWLKEDGGILLLTTGEKIPVSKPNKETVRQALQHF